MRTVQLSMVNGDHKVEARSGLSDKDAFASFIQCLSAKTRIGETVILEIEGAGATPIRLSVASPE